MSPGDTRTIEYDELYGMYLQMQKYIKEKTAYISDLENSVKSLKYKNYELALEKSTYQWLSSNEFLDTIAKRDKLKSEVNKLKSRIKKLQFEFNTFMTRIKILNKIDEDGIELLYFLTNPEPGFEKASKIAQIIKRGIK